MGKGCLGLEERVNWVPEPGVGAFDAQLK